MAIAKTRLVNITSNLNDLDRVLSRFVELNTIHPVLASEFTDKVHGLTTFSSENPCNVILKELTDMEEELDFQFPVREVCQVDHTLENMGTYIKTAHQKLVGLLEQKKVTLELVRKYQDALIQVKNIESLDISLDDVFSCDYVVSRVGRLPTDSVEKLKFYQSRPFIFKSFHEDKNYSWCMYFTSNEFEREVDNIFSSLFFERIHIPDFVHGTPEAAEVQLVREIEATTAQLEKVKVSLYELMNEYEDEFSAIKSELYLLNRIYEAKKYVVGLGDKFTITGFIEPCDEKELLTKYKDMKNVEILFRPALSDKRLLPPTKLKNNWFVRPFSMFVEMYGIPTYGDIDPTPFLAITYALLFGIMFGDVGQGILLSLMGYFFYKKMHLQLGEIAMRIGIASTFFGFVYGSLFGNDELLPALYEKLGITFLPFSVLDSEYSLILFVAAVSLGALLIIISIILNMILKIKHKQFMEFLLSHNGFLGLALYLYVFGGLLLKLAFSINIYSKLATILFVAVPLVLIFMKEPFERLVHKEKMFPEGFGGFLVEGIFELFEIVLSYVTNTMSFMRVGGFVLSHASMMLVVFTFMDMSGTMVGKTLIFIIGNLFVMGLEGLIVGIQVLRLEFYEMFSRYYEGNGVPFQSLKS